MSTIGIYKIENKINGKVYIGQSQNIFKRWSVHGNKNKANNCNMVIAKAITKYGVENFRFEILELCTKEELNIKEKHWVSVYNSYKNGYNSTTGGDAPDEFASSKLTKDTVKILLQELKANIIPMVDLAKKYNVAVEFALHDQDYNEHGIGNKNYHFHLITTTRAVSFDSENNLVFGKKTAFEKLTLVVVILMVLVTVGGLIATAIGSII